MTDTMVQQPSKTCFDLHDIANHLNQCLEESPTAILSLMNVHVNAPRKDAEGRTFGFPVVGNESMMFNVLGLLSGMGDGQSMITPHYSTEGHVLGFVVKPVNTLTGGNSNEI